MRREPSRDQRPPTPAHQYVPDRAGGFPSPVSSMYPPFGAAPAPPMIFSFVVQGLYGMLSTPLGQHILDYDPPCGFSIPPFAMYDGSSDPYDHMLHFNQAMILNAGDDRLLCKVFPASLKGPALAWFHKLPRGSINTFGELWVAFVFQYLCSVRQKGNISSLQSILKREDESIRDFTRMFRQAVQQSTIWMRSYKTFEEALDQPPCSSNLYPWTRRKLWRNCIDGRINSLRWNITSEPPRKPS